MPSNLERMIRLAEEFFATKNDPAQISVTEEVMKRLREIHPASLSEHDDGNGPVAWVLLIPTTSELMNRFIAKQITENELLEQTPVPGSTMPCISVRPSSFPSRGERDLQGS